MNLLPPVCNVSNVQCTAFHQASDDATIIGQALYSTRSTDAGVTSITRTDPFLNLRQNGDRNSFKLVKNLRMVFGGVYVRLPMGRSCPSW